MSIDSISGPKGPKGPTSKPLSSGSLEATSQAQAPGASQVTVQSLAAQVRQGQLSYDDAVTRFAADVVARRYPNITGELRQKAIQEVGRALAEDPSFKGRFSRLLAETQ